MKTQNAPAIRLKDYRPPDYLIKTASLDFQLHAEKTIVKSVMQIERNNTAKKTVKMPPLVLDGDELKFINARLDGEPLDKNAFDVSQNHFTLKAPPSRFTLEIKTVINPSANTKLSGLYRSGGNYCTQCEAEGFRRITYFLDRPDVLSVYTVRLEADKKQAPILLANGNPGKKGTLKNGRHFAEWHDPHPKPSYLFALVGGPLGAVKSKFVTSTGNKVELGIYVQKGKQKFVKYAMDALIRSMRWDEKVFGCIYDLDVFNIVAVPDFNMGAMENKGLNIFNDKYVLADSDTATDSDFANIEAIIAHEYFHNWTGNRITCRDWFQLCLKEGLTVYRDQEFSSDMRSPAVIRIKEVARLKATQFAEDAGPLSHPVRPSQYREINNFYTATVYEKGAEIVRMIATLLGQAGFMRGMKKYLKRHDGEAATVEQFIKCFEEAGRTDLSQFFLWYSQAGTPNLLITDYYDKDKNRLKIEIEQTLAPTPGQAEKKPMHIPLGLGFIGAKTGEELKPKKVTGNWHDGVVEIKKRREQIIFEGIKEQPVLSVNRGFSAPVNIDYRQSESELATLARHDSDGFNRWSAMQKLAQKQIFLAMRMITKRDKIQWSKAWFDAARMIAEAGELEPAYRALLLGLPGENEIAQILGRNVDPDAIFKARQALRAELGKVLAPIRKPICQALKMPKKFRPDAEGAGKRALFNLLLSYACAAGDKDALAQIHDNYAKADNMTDRLAALTMILHYCRDKGQTQAALDRFYVRYKDNAIVLDNWFALQALVPGAAGLKNARALVKHDDFSWKTPNRVRSVIGSFVMGNPTAFNHKNGSGYHFVKSAIARLDKINPQIAARLATGFKSWKVLEPERRAKARASLAELKKTPGLSRDLADIVERTLG